MRHEHEHDESPEHRAEFLSEVLGVLVARLGGVAEVSNEELEVQRRKYGVPAPLIIGKDEAGVLVRMCTIEEMPERGVDVVEARPLTGVEAVARARELVDEHRLGVYGDRTPGWSFRVGKAMHERLEGYMASLPLAGLIEVPRDIEQLLWGYPVVIDPEAEPDTLELRGPMRFTLGDENPAGCTCLGGAYGVHRPPCQYAEAKPFA